MPVFTIEEFEKIQKKGIPAITTEPEKINPVTISMIEYYLWYPDNIAGSYHNGKYCYSENITLDIIDGILKTDDINIKTDLVKRGFTFMYEKEKEEE